MIEKDVKFTFFFYLKMTQINKFDVGCFEK